MPSPTPSSIRLPPALRAQIRDRAAAERRSFSSQARVLLESALAEPRPSRTITAAEVERLARRLAEGR